MSNLEEVIIESNKVKAAFSETIDEIGKRKGKAEQIENSEEREIEMIKISRMKDETLALMRYVVIAIERIKV